MRVVLVAALLIALASPALAGGNEGVWGYITFDPAAVVTDTIPAPYSTVNAYICFSGIQMGFTSASFRLNDVAAECPGSFAPPSFVNTISDVAVGNIFTGITVAAQDCVVEPTVCVGYLSLFYLGTGSCCVKLLEHPDYPRWVTDCNDPAQVDTYCVHAHGSIAGGDCPPNECDSPATPETWSSIKALYR